MPHILPLGGMSLTVKVHGLLKKTDQVLTHSSASQQPCDLRQGTCLFFFFSMRKTVKFFTLRRQDGGSLWILSIGEETKKCRVLPTGQQYCEA